MKRVLLFMSLYIIWGYVCSSYASERGTEIPLSVRPTMQNAFIGGLSPLDDNNSPGTFPIDPTNFHAYVLDNRLTVLGPANVTANLVVRNEYSVVIVSTQFADSISVYLPTTGLHYVEINNQLLTLVGQWMNTNTENFSSTLTWDIRHRQYCYNITIFFPSFEVRDTALIDPIAQIEVPFNYVLYSAEEENQKFSYAVEAGNPALPFLPLNLHIPFTEAIDTLVDGIEYYDEIELSYPYLPAQNVLETANDALLQFNEEFYDWGENGDWEQPVVTQLFEYMGSAGMNVQFRPVLYAPLTNTIRPVRSISFKVCIPDSTFFYEIDTVGFHPERADIIDFYDNYQPYRPFTASHKGNYLIITTPDFESEADFYAQHKTDCGYNAWVETFSSTSTAADIRQYLRESCLDEDYRPRYVLIIGDGTIIPFSAGSSNDPDDPLTDMYYACLDSASIAQETSLVPDVYVGRWPVSSSGQLANIMQKSIDYDDYTIPNRRVALFSGTGSGADRFAAVNMSVHTMIQNDVTHASSINYDGRAGLTDEDMTDEFSNNDDWMMIYRGHGNMYEIGSPYNIGAWNIPEEQPYFSFGIACLLNYPSGIGEYWVNYGDRGCAFYGATVETYREYNNLLEKTMFNGLKDHVNYTLGKFIYQGLANYLSARGSKLEVQSYVLYGDPSLYLYGLNTAGNPVNYKPRRSGGNESSESIAAINGESSYAIYTLQGALLLSATVQDISQRRDAIQQLPQGVYIIRVTGGETQEMMRKIVIP